MEWNDDLNIDVAFIDNQHKKLVKVITKLQNSLTTNYVDLQMAETLKFLVSYTQHHFTEEEELMNSIGYPDYNRHQQLHLKLITDIKQILIKIKNKKPINAADLIDFLIKWVKDHIVEEDKEIKHHILKMKTKGNAPEKKSNTDIIKNLNGKLGEMKELFNQSLINDDDYSNKVSHLLHDYISLQAVESKAVLDKHFSFLADLFKKELITDNVYIASQKQLLETVNIEEIINEINDNVEKMKYLNSFVEKKIIDNETFETYKTTILDNL